jgi:hypothetical protein
MKWGCGVSRDMGGGAGKPAAGDAGAPWGESALAKISYRGFHPIPTSHLKGILRF